MSIFLVATPFRHRDLNIFRIFTIYWSSITLSRCRCHEAKKIFRAQLCILSRGCSSMRRLSLCGYAHVIITWMFAHTQIITMWVCACYHHMDVRAYADYHHVGFCACAGFWSWRIRGWARWPSSSPSSRPSAPSYRLTSRPKFRETSNARCARRTKCLAQSSSPPPPLLARISC